MDPGSADKEDASDIFLKNDPNDIFKRLNIPPHAVDRSIPKTGKALALATGPAVVATGRAAGLLDIFEGAAAAGSNAVSYLSYFMMKQRAGAVGADGVAPLIDQLASAVERIHLIGHSFGGRVVAAAALMSKNEKIHSVSFLQAAFSHNGFSPAALMNGFFRPVIEMQRVKGALVATHTKNDTAVGIAYPLASRISGTVAAGLGDENDKYGGLGRNGAQQMNTGEVIKADLLPVGKTYSLTPGKIHNLRADDFVKNHGDVTGPEVVAAVAAAAL
jgi:predicted alpha/beta hydrolase family esterase